MNPRRASLTAFTLVELIVSFAVLAIIGLLISQVINAVGMSTKLSNRAIDASAQARLVFDRIGVDLDLLLKRADADFYARDPMDAANAGYDPANLLLFLSGTSSAGVQDNRGFSLVAYRLSAHPDNGGRPCLLRAGRPISWSRKTFMGLGATGAPVRFRAGDPNFPQDLLPGGSDFDVLAPGVIGIAIGYQLYPDGKSVVLKDGSSTQSGIAQGQIVYSAPAQGASASSGIDLKRISSIVVAIVALDLESLRLLTPENVGDLAGAFAPPDTENKLPVQFWMEKTGNLSQLPGSVPPPVRQSVRLFQRFYPVTPFGERNEN